MRTIILNLLGTKVDMPFLVDLVLEDVGCKFSISSFRQPDAMPATQSRVFMLIIILKYYWQ